MIAPLVERPLSVGRFAGVGGAKASGVAYTPRSIADYLAGQIVRVAGIEGRDVTILDPALGDGALALALLQAVFSLDTAGPARVRLVGHETDPRAAGAAREALTSAFPSVDLDLRETDFLSDPGDEAFDLAIANPPYVRTQILGARGAGELACRYGLTGRVDLYQAFALELIERLRPGGALGLILSNRFLSTKGAAAFRDALNTRLDLLHLWDLGDTKVFDQAVLPAMLLARRKPLSGQQPDSPPRPSDAAGPGLDGGPPALPPARFTAIYEAHGSAGSEVASLVEALDREGGVRWGGRAFTVSQGRLHGAVGEVWRLSSSDLDDWLHAVEARTWKRLGEIGKIRVGIKTTADRVFIRGDWQSMGAEAPELLRPLLTHHVAGRYRGSAPVRQVLYPHIEIDGRRSVVDLSEHPRSKAYLARHRASLEAREYVLAAGRAWYEIWVPHSPSLWSRPKLVFRDISERPTFWIDDSGSVVNGDCYWLSPEDHVGADVLWLALAVANSRFIEAFYDRCFHNKLYSRRRRFMSQYVEKFPLPSPDGDIGEGLVRLARARHASVDPSEQASLELSMDALVWRSFGLDAG